MKTTAFDNFKDIITDRVFLTTLILGSIMTVITVILISFMIKPSEIQLTSHYTAFSQVGFFRTQWQYLIVFAAFPIISWVIHCLLAIRIYVDKDRRYALTVLGLGIVIVLIAFIIARSILGVASLI